MHLGRWLTQVLLHDFPEVLCDYHYAFCGVIPPNCIANYVALIKPRSTKDLPPRSSCVRSLSSHSSACATTTALMSNTLIFACFSQAALFVPYGHSL